MPILYLTPFYKRLSVCLLYIDILFIIPLLFSQFHRIYDTIQIRNKPPIQAEENVINYY